MQIHSANIQVYFYKTSFYFYSFTVIFKNAYISAHMCKPVSSPYLKMLFQSPDEGRDFRHVH